MKQSKTFGLITILLIYIIATAIGIITFIIFEGENIYVRILLADITATIVVYLIGSILKNASVYDPYWSVQPMVILISTTNPQLFSLLQSIPMADKRNSKKPGFTEYVNETRCLLPIRKPFITNPFDEEDTYKNIL